MAFNRSLAQRLRYRPWRYTTPPTYDAQGNETSPGVRQELNGVFILLSDELIEMLASTDALTAAEKQQLRDMAHRVTVEEAGEWHVPVWAGQDSAVYIRVPAAVWNTPDGTPPAKVKKFFQNLWREISA